MLDKEGIHTQLEILVPGEDRNPEHRGGANDDPGTDNIECAHADSSAGVRD